MKLLLKMGGLGPRRVLAYSVVWPSVWPLSPEQ